MRGAASKHSVRTPAGQEPQWKLQAQLCEICRIDLSLFAGGKSRLKSADKRDMWNEPGAVS